MSDDEGTRLSRVFTEYELINKLTAQLDANAREHRQHLENLLDRTVKVIYVIGGLVVAAAGLFGVKTLVDVSDRATKAAELRVDQYITKEFVAQQVQKRINQYSRGSLITFLAVRAASSGHPDGSSALRDDDVAVLQDVLRNPTSESFGDALRVVRFYTIARDADREEVANTLIDILQNHLDGKNRLSPSVVVDLIRTIAHLRHQASVPVLMRCIDEELTAMPIRVAASAALAEVADEENAMPVANNLLQHAARLRDEGSDLYPVLVSAACRLRSDESRVELEKLVAATDARHYSSLAAILPSILTLKFYSADQSTRIAYVGTIARFFLSERVALDADVVSRSIFDDWEPQLTLMIQNDTGGASGASFPPEAAESELLTAAAIQGYRLCNGAARTNYFRRILAPIAALGHARFQRAIATGYVGAAADPLVWQDHFVFRLKGDAATAVNRALLDVTSGGWSVASVNGLLGPIPPSATPEDIDPASLMWIQQPRRQFMAFKTP